MPDAAHLGEHITGLAEGEGGGGHALEVLMDVRVVIGAHQVQHFVAQGEAVGIKLARVLGAPAAIKEAAGGGVELEHEALFPAGPGFR